MNEKGRADAAAAEDRHLLHESCSAKRSRLGKPAMPPYVSHDSAPQMFAVRRHVWGGAPFRHACRNPASKQSPAPVVSNAVTPVGAWKYSSPSLSSAAPFAPSFSATHGKPAAANRFNIRSGSVSPVIRAASVSLGKK